MNSLSYRWPDLFGLTLWRLSPSTEYVTETYAQYPPDGNDKAIQPDIPFSEIVFEKIIAKFNLPASTPWAFGTAGSHFQRYNLNNRRSKHLRTGKVTWPFSVEMSSVTRYSRIHNAEIYSRGLPYELRAVYVVWPYHWYDVWCIAHVFW